MPRSSNPVPQYFTDQNKILVGGKMFYFEAGTNDPKPTFANKEETIQNPHPVVLDGEGRLPDVFFSDTAKQVLKDSNLVQIWERDDVSGGIDSFGLNQLLINDLSQAYEFATVAAYKAFNTPFPIGKVINLLDRKAEFLVISGTGSANTFYIIASDQVSQSISISASNEIYADQFGANGDGVSTGNELPIQSALDYAAAVSKATAKSKVTLRAGGRYFIDNEIEIPGNIELDITGCEIFCSAVTAFTLGNNSTLRGNNAEVVTSGTGGSAIRRTDQGTSGGFNILGWPSITSASPRPGNNARGVDALGSYRANIEVTPVNYDIGIVVGGANSPVSYYSLLNHCSPIGCTTGILIGESANGYTIIAPNINGSSVGRTGIHIISAVNGFISGGYIEGHDDNAQTRGILFDGATACTVVGVGVENASTTNNFAIGMVNNASDLDFINMRPGAAWNSAGKTLTNNGTGVFSWRGLNPFTKQMINLLAVRDFVGDETQGMYKSSNDQAGTNSAARTRFHKAGSTLGVGQKIGCIEFTHEDVTDPGLVAEMCAITESGTDGSTGLVFSTGNATTFAGAWRIDSSRNLTPITDADPNLGSPSLRVKEVFASVGAINTSDRNEKTEIKDLSIAEQGVATRLKGLIKTFKFKDAVDKKGDAARIHCGVIAQEVFDSFAAEGLNAEDYACYCSDVWWEALITNEVEKGVFEDIKTTFNDKSKIPTDATSIKEITRLGVRPDQLLYFMMSSI